MCTPGTNVGETDNEVQGTGMNEHEHINYDFIYLAGLLDGEGCIYKLNDVAMIVTAGYPDIRRVINSAQRQVVDGKLKIDVSSVIQNNYKLQLIELLSNGSKINDIRQLIADNLDDEKFVEHCKKFFKGKNNDDK